MNADNSIVPYLFMVTFLVAIGIGLWQYNRARKAKRVHHRSADAKVHGDAPSTEKSAPRSDR